MFENVRVDLERSVELNHQGQRSRWTLISQFFHVGTQAVLIYRFGRWALGLRVPVIKHLLLVLYYLSKYMVNLMAGINIPTQAEIGPGLIVHTWNGVYVPPCKIGRNCYFQHGVVVNYFCKGIGDDVYFGPGAKVIKGIRIGDRVKVGANAVVVSNLPDDCTAVGIPARIVPTKPEMRPADTDSAEPAAVQQR